MNIFLVRCSNLLSISLLQKRAVINLSGAELHYHSNIVFVKLNVLHVCDHVHYKTAATKVTFHLLPTNNVSFFPRLVKTW